MGVTSPAEFPRPSRRRDHPLTRSVAGMIGMGVLAMLILLCVGSLPFTLGSTGGDAQAPPRYAQSELAAYLIPPTWTRLDTDERARLDLAASRRAAAATRSTAELASDNELIQPSEEEIAAHRPSFVFGSDKLGRSVLIRCLAGGGVSIGIGIAAAAISVIIGTLYGSLAGYIGGRIDAFMMRIVDILYGLPYILLVVLLAVAGDALLSDWVSQRPAREAHVESRAAMILTERGEGSSASEVAKALRFEPELREELEAEAREKHPPRAISEERRKLYEVFILLVAIGGVSWLTMARVIRGQVMSLKEQPFIEAARALGVPVHRVFVRHLLPNVLGPVIVYATLTVPQAILQESFLSFLGIGVRPPLPSWGNLAAEGLVELNPVRVRWWLILFPCLLLGVTLLALNFVGEGLREAFDPKRARK